MDRAVEPAEQQAWGTRGARLVGGRYASEFWRWRRNRAVKLANVRCAQAHLDNAIERAMSAHIDERFAGFLEAMEAMSRLIQVLEEVQE